MSHEPECIAIQDRIDQWICFCDTVLAIYQRGLKDGAKLVRNASDADEAVKRVRALHAPFNSYCSGCLDPYCKGETVVCGECGESFYPYPCDTIKALDGEQA